MIARQYRGNSNIRRRGQVRVKRSITFTMSNLLPKRRSLFVEEVWAAVMVGSCCWAARSNADGLGKTRDGRKFQYHRATTAEFEKPMTRNRKTRISIATSKSAPWNSSAVEQIQRAQEELNDLWHESLIGRGQNLVRLYVRLNKWQFHGSVSVTEECIHPLSRRWVKWISLRLWATITHNSRDVTRIMTHLVSGSTPAIRNNSCGYQCHRPDPSQLANLFILARKSDHPPSTQTQKSISSFETGLVSM